MRRCLDAIHRRKAAASELGQTAIVAVLAITMLCSTIGLVLVNTVHSPLTSSAASVQIYANRALEAGENAYLDAINTNPSLAQCSTALKAPGPVAASSTASGTRSKARNVWCRRASITHSVILSRVQPTTHALVSLSVEIVGAANDNSAQRLPLRPGDDHSHAEERISRQRLVVQL